MFKDTRSSSAGNKSIEKKIRTPRSNPEKVDQKYLKYTESGKSDQSEIANSEKGVEAAKKLADMRKKYKLPEVNYSNQDTAVYNLKPKDKGDLYVLKNNMEEDDMKRIRKDFSDAERLKELHKLASAYIKSDTIDCEAKEFLGELCEAHDKLAGEVLLRSFEKSFPDATQVIRENEPFLQLVREAAGQGAKFAGYGEDGPAKMDRGQCAGDKVWIPKPKNDTSPWETVGVFLFELNNSLHAPKIEELRDKITPKTTISRDEYVQKRIALEADSVLKIGEIWSKVRKEKISENLSKYDDHFLFRLYQSEGKVNSKDDIIETISKDTAKGGTYEEMFKEQYNRILNPHN